MPNGLQSHHAVSPLKIGFLNHKLFKVNFVNISFEGSIALLKSLCAKYCSLCEYSHLCRDSRWYSVHLHMFVVVCLPVIERKGECEWRSLF
jgi:hypothetical protein